MRFKTKPRPKAYDKRTKLVFAIFPIRIGDTYVFFEYYIQHQFYSKYRYVWVDDYTEVYDAKAA